MNNDNLEVDNDPLSIINHGLIIIHLQIHHSKPRFPWRSSATPSRVSRQAVVFGRPNEALSELMPLEEATLQVPHGHCWW